jgi:FKBP-type peptidyl-prolyl cis-trans isomerase 2
MKHWTITMTVAVIVGLVFVPVPVLGNNQSPVAPGSTVLIEFTITVPDSRLMFPKNVSQFVPGRNEMLPNLERALVGMKRGDEKRVDLTPDEAFGPYDESKKTFMSKERLPAGTKPGTVLKTAEGIPFVVVDLSGSEAAVDFNHPLAGKRLLIDVKILDVEPAT